MARTSTGSGSRKKDGPPPGGAADLELTDDQRYSLTEQHRKKYEILIVAQKAAVKAVRDFGKIVKADLGENGLDDIKGLIDLATPEGESRIKAGVERQMRLMRWMQVPIGTTEDMFPKTDIAPITERAFGLGRRHALAGQSRENPHHHTTDAHRSYNDGYDEGQADKVKNGIKKLDTTPKGSHPDAVGDKPGSFKVVN